MHCGRVYALLPVHVSRETLTVLLCAWIAGARVDYAYTVSNPGNVMVRNIRVSAPGVGPLTCNSSSTGVAVPDAGFTNMTVYQVVVCR
jgi:hypothetical protein